MLFAIQLAVSLILVSWLLRRIDLSAIREELSRARLPLAVLGAALFFGRNVLAAFRWQLLLRAIDIHRSIATLFKHYMISYFASSVLPSAVAGDLGRTFLIGARPSSVAASVTVERLAGTLAVGLFAHALLFLDGAEFQKLKLALVAVDLGIVLFVLVAWILMRSPRLQDMTRWRPRFLLGFFEALHVYRQPGALLFVTFLLSLIFQALGILGIVVFGRAIGDATAAWIYFALLPAFWLFSLIPISIGGFGLREGAFVYLFTQAGGSDVHANVLALFLLLMAVFQAVIGALLAPGEIARRRMMIDRGASS